MREALRGFYSMVKQDKNKTRNIQQTLNCKKLIKYVIMIINWVSDEQEDGTFRLIHRSTFGNW